MHKKYEISFDAVVDFLFQSFNFEVIEFKQNENGIVGEACLPVIFYHIGGQ